MTPGGSSLRRARTCDSRGPHAVHMRRHDTMRREQQTMRREAMRREAMRRDMLCICDAVS